MALELFDELGFGLGRPLERFLRLLVQHLGDGLPLLFFLLLSGGNPDAFFAHVANLGDRFLAADLARRVTFLGQCKFVLIGLATLVVVWRMPRFIRDLDRELSGEKL